MTTVAELAELAGGHLRIGKYLNKNPEVLSEFLEGETEASQVREFAVTYLADYNKLYSEAMDRVKFLSFFRKEGSPVLSKIENGIAMKNPIETFGYKYVPP